MTPVSRLSEHDQQRSETDISENFPPETFRGEVVSRGDVVVFRQPENSRNFDENTQNYDAFGRERDPENASQIQIQDQATPPQSSSDVPMAMPPTARVTNRRTSDDYASDVIARARDRERTVYPWPAPDQRSQGSTDSRNPGFRERSPRKETTSIQHLVETADLVGTPDAANTFFACDAEATWQPSKEYFQIKKPVSKDAEIKVADLPSKAQKLFTGTGGAREKEWKNMVGAVSPEGGPAVRVLRGKQAREYRARYAHRIVPSRWHEKWKDMGDDFDNGLDDKTIAAAHLGAKSRWILLGSHDPDIALLNRSGPLRRLWMYH